MLISLALEMDVLIRVKDFSIYLTLPKLKKMKLIFQFSVEIPYTPLQLLSYRLCTHICYKNAIFPSVQNAITARTFISISVTYVAMRWPCVSIRYSKELHIPGVVHFLQFFMKLTTESTLLLQNTDSGCVPFICCTY